MASLTNSVYRWCQVLSTPNKTIRRWSVYDVRFPISGSRQRRALRPHSFSDNAPPTKWSVSRLTPVARASLLRYALLSRYMHPKKSPRRPTFRVSIFERQEAKQLSRDWLPAEKQPRQRRVVEKTKTKRLQTVECKICNCTCLSRLTRGIFLWIYFFTRRKCLWFQLLHFT